MLRSSLLATVTAASDLCMCVTKAPYWRLMLERLMRFGVTTGGWGEWQRERESVDEGRSPRSNPIK